MNQETAKLKCPVCGKLIIVSKQQIDGINPNKAVLTCPGCKSKQKLSEYKRIETRQDSQTEYPGSGMNHSQGRNNDEGHTQYKETGENQQIRNSKIGKLRLPNGETVQLKEGEQVIGRHAENPPYPDIRIPESTRRMSRQHLVIEVKKEPGGGYVHLARLFKQRVNVTAIGGARMDIKDGIKLHNGDVLRLPGADIKFELENGEPRKGRGANEETIFDF